MTDATVGQLIAAIPSTVASITAAIVAFAALRKGNQNGVKADAANTKQDTLIEKAVEIHTQTNGQMSKLTNALDVALAKIEGLEKLIASMVAAKSAADLLAENKTQR